MKKLIILFLFLPSLLFSQVSPSKIARIADANTVFGSALSYGTYLVVQSNNKTYKIISVNGVAGTAKLSDLVLNTDYVEEGSVTSVSTAAANNGVTATWSMASPTPALTIGLGAITPTSVNGLTLTALATGFTVAGGTTSKTLTVPLDASVSGTNTGDQTTITGNAGSATNLAGGAGGSIPYQSAAGTTAMLANGTAGQVLQSNGTTLAPTWVAAGAGDMILGGVQTVTGAKTFGTSGGAVGKLIVAGSTSGSTILDATPVAGSGTVTLPTTGTLATLAGAETLTNKDLTSGNTFPTFNQNTSGNAANVTGIVAPANGGTGIANNAAMTVTGAGNFAYTRTLTAATNVTFPTSGTLVSSVTTGNGVSASNTAGALGFTLGVITPTSVNGLTLTALATGFTVAGGTTSKTLTVPLDAAVSGTNTGDNAANSSSTFIGTTSVALNRSSAALTLGGITLTTPDIGTPSAGVATNITGLPLTTGVTGILPLANGGSNANLTAVNGGVVWSNASQMQVTAVGTANQVLISNGAAAPSFSSSALLSINTPTTGGTALTATGTTQATALALTADYNEVTGGTVATEDGVALPALVAGRSVYVLNRNNFPIDVFPFNASGTVINGLAANAAYILPPNGGVEFKAINSKWYTITPSGQLINVIVKTSGTSYTPTDGTNAILVKVVGGGGGGGGSATTNATANGAGGGGAGGYSEQYYTTAGKTFTYAVGVAGVGGVAGAAGNSVTASTASTFTDGTTAISGGGGGGGATMASATTVANSAGGVGGTSSGGQVNISGPAGGFGLRISGTNVYSGSGGSSLLGPGGIGIAIGPTTTITAGNAGTIYGGGGGGSVNLKTGAPASATVNGGNGAAGVVIIYEYR